jgi:hypothetical protein
MKIWKTTVSDTRSQVDGHMFSPCKGFFYFTSQRMPNSNGSYLQTYAYVISAKWYKLISLLNYRDNNICKQDTWEFPLQLLVAGYSWQWKSQERMYTTKVTISVESNSHGHIDNFYLIRAIPLCKYISILYILSYTTIYIKLTRLHVTILLAFYMLQFCWQQG